MKQVTESPHLHHEPPTRQRESAGQSKTPLTLPPAGPSWAGAVMGSASLAQVVDIYWGASMVGHAAAVAWYFIATGMLAWVIAGFVRHRNPQFVPEHLPAWAMTAMGILALSMATSVMLGWWWLHASYWALGTVLAFVVSIRYLAHLVYLPRAEYSSVNFTWSLPLLAPVVNAASAGMLARHITGIPSFLVHAIGVVGLLLVLVTAVPLLVAVYIGLGRKKLKIPPNFITIYWIPLGLVGQATAAAQLLGRSEPWDHLAYGFGVATMVIGIPVAIIAATNHWPRVLRNSMAYNPTWWSCVFPLGTVVSGLKQMNNASGQVVWIGIGNVLLLLLIAHWCWAFFGGVWNIQQRRG
ncbi:SLAC1 family transporter [Corynebacterium propinquum]